MTFNDRKYPTSKDVRETDRHTDRLTDRHRQTETEFENGREECGRVPPPRRPPTGPQLDRRACGLVLDCEPRDPSGVARGEKTCRD